MDYHHTQHVSELSFARDDLSLALADMRARGANTALDVMQRAADAADGDSRENFERAKFTRPMIRAAAAA